MKTAQQHNAEQGVGQYEFHENQPANGDVTSPSQIPSGRACDIRDNPVDAEAPQPLVFENIDPARIKMQVTYLRSGETRVHPIGSSLLYGHLGNRDKDVLYAFTLIIDP